MYVMPCLNNGRQGYLRGMRKMKASLLGTVTQITVRAVVSMLLVPSVGIRGVALGCIAGWAAQILWQAPYRMAVAHRAAQEAMQSENR